MSTRLPPHIRGDTFEYSFTLGNDYTGASFTGGVKMTFRREIPGAGVFDDDDAIDQASTATGEITFDAETDTIGTVVIPASRATLWPTVRLVYDVQGVITGSPDDDVRTIDIGTVMVVGDVTRSGLVAAGLPVVPSGKFATLAALALANGAEGMLAYVDTQRAIWIFRLGSEETVDGASIIDGIDGQWFRLPIPHPSWATEADWYVDPAAGDDENDGLTTDTALATVAEVTRRINGQTLQQQTTIWLMGDCAEHPIIKVHQSETEPGARVLLRGHSSAWTTVRTGSITSFTDLVRTAPSEAMIVTDTSIDDWTNYLGFRVRLTSGAGAGACFFPVKRISATQARCTPANTFDPTSALFYAGRTIPTVGNTYVIERLPGIYGMTVEVTRASHSGQGQQFRAVVSDIEIGKGLATPELGTIQIRSGISSLPALSAWIGHCRILVREIVGDELGIYGSLFDARFASSSQARFWGAGVHAGGCIGSFRGGSHGRFFLSEDFTIQGSGSPNSGLRCLTNWSIQANGMAVFDAANDAVQVGLADAVDCVVAAPLYGTGSTGSGVQIDAGAIMRLGSVANVPTITGGGAQPEANIGGTGVTWAAIAAGPGSVNAAKMCGIVVV